MSYGVPYKGNKNLSAVTEFSMSAICCTDSFTLRIASKRWLKPINAIVALSTLDFVSSIACRSSSTLNDTSRIKSCRLPSGLC